MFKTHIAMGFLVGLLTLPYLPVQNKFLFLILVAVCASLPDIDHARSKINNQFQLFKIVSFLFRHRGIMHSLLAVLILGVLAYRYLGHDIAYAFFIGFTAHILGDALTKNGVELFYPLTRWKIRGFIITGSFFEKLFFAAMLLATIYKIANLV